ncbi:hypothetical protein DRO64_03405 [Candidatus Bathyarchaeota archaeon]|nr:MAG: hypothetical protein DRO64_03405 [Candidatus Bathyarchaeota archaeon]
MTTSIKLKISGKNAEPALPDNIIPMTNALRPTKALATEDIKHVPKRIFIHGDQKPLCQTLLIIAVSRCFHPIF